MRPRSIVLLLAVIVLAVFAGLNWQSLLATTPISLLLFEIEAPLGLLLLLAVALMTLLFLGLVAYLEAQARQERKRLNKDIEHWKALAEKAEGSRIQELREVVEAGFDDLYDRLQGVGPGGSARRPEGGDRLSARSGPPAPVDEALTEPPEDDSTVTP